MRSGVCVECEQPFDHAAVTGPVSLTCSDECRRVRRLRFAGAPDQRQRVAEWHRTHPDRIAETKQRWLESNPQKRRQSSSEYTKRNRGKASEQTRRYRALKRDLTIVPFTAEQLEQRFSMFAGCWICGRSDTRLEADHVKPVAVGGAHVLANLRPACRSCNARKGKKWPPTPQEPTFSIAAAIGIG